MSLPGSLDPSRGGNTRTGYTGYTFGEQRGWKAVVSLHRAGGGGYELRASSQSVPESLAVEDGSGGGGVLAPETPMATLPNSLVGSHGGGVGARLEPETPLPTLPKSLESTHGELGGALAT